MLIIVDIMTAPSRSAGFQYRSKQEINGWPLIHINIGWDPETGRSRVARGVVAIGSRAVGVVSIGAVALGVVTLAGVGLGLVSLAAVAVGIVAVGSVAVGYEVAIGAVVLVVGFVLGLFGLG